MRRWKHHVRIKHLFTKSEDHASIQESMINIAHAISNEICFNKFSRVILKKFMHIPKGDGIIEPVDYANKLLVRVYDFADANDMWIK